MAVKKKRIKSGRRVSDEGTYVSPFWQRMIAFVVDLVLLMLVVVASASGLGWIELDQIPLDPRWGFLDQVADLIHGQGPGLVRTSFMALAVAWGYGWITEWLFQGTPGTRFVGAKVIDETGARPGPGKLLFRNGVKMISFLCLGLGGIWAAFDGERRALHDRLSGTYVVRSTEN